MRILSLCLSLFFATVSVGADAQQAVDVQLVGILGKKAVLTVNGERHLLQEGQATPQGVRLERLLEDSALLTIAGERREIRLGDRIGGAYAERTTAKTFVYPDRNGMYVTIGRINGFPANMLLDTGATSVALDANSARRIGLNYKIEGQPLTVATASGQAPAYLVSLRSVAVGDITLNDVEAVVIEGAGPDIPLLGMSFLRRLNVTTDGSAMVLETR